LIMPRVSICLPNLNHRPWLRERLDTIWGQSFTDWELIVVDGYSDDGAWEFLQSAAGSDPRVRLHQAPRRGPYGAWNDCRAMARGEFIYFATSDDTMTADCLGEMVTALERHPECDIAQCCLNAIGADGQVMEDWWKLTAAARFLGDDYLRPHRRIAPYDGVVHCAMGTIYHSITQVLLRRSVFEQTGPFPTEYGPGGDFLWGMVAGLTCNVVHVPRFLATWRIHDRQASAGWRCDAADRWRMRTMTVVALERYRRTHPQDARLPRRALLRYYTMEHYRRAYAEASGRAARLRVLLRMATRAPDALVESVRLRSQGRWRDYDAVEHTHRLLRRLDLESNLIRDA
jgi:glycosyltransferase involved in cell wall biosynthesis